MMTSIHLQAQNVVTAVVSQDLCIGCGLCVPVCPSEALEMRWNEYGLAEPALIRASCSGCPACLRVCPFAEQALSVATGLHQPDEDEMGADLFAGAQTQRDPYLGYFQALYAGYAEAYRSDGSSGGLSTWALIHLLENDLIDAAFCVQPVEDTAQGLFAYGVCETPEAVRGAAKTRYYPAPVDQVIGLALRQPGRYALVGLPCTLKALRLAQEQQAELRQRIVFTVGIFCGGLKSRGYTEYLAAAAGVAPGQVRRPQYRVKQPLSTAGDYVFACEDGEGRQHAVAMRRLGDMWGTGLFKANACEYCDDLSAELADLSLGDAWMAPYEADGRGNNLVVVRSDLAAQIIDNGMASGELRLDPIGPAQAYATQQGNINHRRHGLAYRLHLAKKQGLAIPRKRVLPRRSFDPLWIGVQRTRMRVRRRSHEAWLAQRGTPGTEIFDQLMAPDLRRLQRLTSLSQLVRDPRRLWRAIRVWVVG